MPNYQHLMVRYLVYYHLVESEIMILSDDKLKELKRTVQ